MSRLALCSFAGCAILALAALLTTPGTAAAQMRKTMKPAGTEIAPEPAAPKLVGRLPNYYASAAEVSDEQRQEIYRIQNEYDGRIDALLEEIEELRSERAEKMRDVLTDEQQEKVDLAKAEARQRRAERAGK